MTDSIDQCESLIGTSPFNISPVAPAMLEGDHRFTFQCYPGISCFNACCKNIEITLTPYDVLRLKKRLQLDSSEFLKTYTYPFELEKDGIVAPRFKPVENGTACQFMTEAGCSVYEDRPTACRYYPIAQLAIRRQDEYIDRLSFAKVREDHCKGHDEARSLTVDEYRSEQGVIEYEDIDRGWRQLVLKKKSSGPYIGTPSIKSRQLFFMACYDLDRFRLFTSSQGFRSGFDLPPERWAQLEQDDVALLHFGFDLLRQVLFGEETLSVQTASQEQARQRLKAKQEAQEASAREAREMAEDPYQVPGAVNEA